MILERIENEMNDGWTLVELKELVEDPLKDIVDGPFGSNLKANEYIDTGVPVFKIQNIKANQFIDKNINYISEEKAKELSRHSFKSGDLIITKLGNPLGLCCKVPDKYPYGVIVADLIRFRPSTKKNIDKYLIYAINSIVIQNQFRAFTKGTTRPRVNLTIVRSIKLAFAPLPEQRAIVAKIEQLFSDLDNGIANLKNAQEQLKIYRQAVLKKAFVGELTRKWRAEQTDLPSAEELLLQIKEEREKHYQKQLDEWKKAVKEWEDNGKEWKKPSRPKNLKELPPLSEEELKALPELPEVWCWKKIGNICECIVPNRDKPKSFTGNVKWITTPDLPIDSIRLNYSNVEKGLSEMEITKYNAKVIPLGSVIMTCVGKFGISAIVEKRIVVNQQLHAFLPVNFCYNKYLAYCIQYNKVFFEKRATSTTIQYSNKNNCNSMPFSFCSFQEQHQIVREIETRLSICDKLEETIAEALQKSEALRQSILKKAFEGKLLNEKELEEARNAPDWEPADKLLERINAEKEKPGTKKSF